MPAKRQASKGKAAAPPGGKGRRSALARGAGWGRFAKLAAALAALVLAAWWVTRMEALAVRKRIIQEITAKPAAALWFQQQRLLVEGEGGPDSLWFGEVAEVARSHPVDPAASPKLVKLVFHRGRLLAGRGDAVVDDLAVYVFGHRFEGIEPEAGQHWVVSSRRDEEGNQKIHEGLPFDGSFAPR
jgi:hypothetical protein